MRCRRYNSYRLTSIEANDQWRLLRSLRPFQQHFTEKMPHLTKKKMLPLRQCTGSYVLDTDGQIQQIRYELFLHPAYSPDLAPCDYFLFSNLKKWFAGKIFTREQLIIETEVYFGLDKSYYSDDLKKLKNRWIKCIELKENYVKK